MKRPLADAEIAALLAEHGTWAAAAKAAGYTLSGFRNRAVALGLRTSTVWCRVAEDAFLAAAVAHRTVPAIAAALGMSRSAVRWRAAALGVTLEQAPVGKYPRPKRGAPRTYQRLTPQEKATRKAARAAKKAAVAARIRELQGDGRTLREIGAVLGMSGERVRQILEETPLT